MVAPLVTVIILAIAWCIYWVVASRLVRDQVESRIASLPQSGVTFECASVEWSGFPFRFERDCANPHVKTPEIDISASRMLAVMQAYNYRHVVALIDGPTRIAPALTVTHERAIASARMSAEGDMQASLEVPELSAPGMLAAKRLLLHARDMRKGAIDVAASGEALVLNFPENVTLALDRGHFAASIPAEAMNRDWARILATTGKKVNVTGLHLEKGGLMMDAAGEIGIDRTGRPEGVLTTKANDIGKLMGGLQQTFHIPEGDLKAARAMIALMQNDKDGSVALDLIAKDGKLYWGPVMIGYLAPLF